MRIPVLLFLLACACSASADQPAVPADPQALKAQIQDYYFDAARRGDVQMLQTFIDAGYPLDTQDAQGYTALILAAYHGQGPAVERLLAAGANACVQDKRGNTALMGAIFKGEVRIARRLLNSDCNPDQRNAAGQTAAMYAGLFKRTALLEALAAKGADLQAEDPLGNSAARLVEGQIRTPPTR
ncbi:MULTISPECIES: ankyrin repeat domain-containing protein [Pseudomonas]|uniref:Ankyrin repeat-containing protein n=1 Tax=Pseudomonas asplenii TaxID=53407 RepID=A0A0M9GEK0_9PSED|nr:MULTISPECIES: ankyrin repeat domain-containing protein [Pseudomonas]KPA89204.1 ankyrin repeat-containing protein [Pseudomonas fuscovaginae]KPA96738.1 ankyrin repeat-containing protein [Pseudomonas fuscovaginae]